jgi:hypothetical protein
MNKVKTKILCPKCNNLFSKKGGNYKRHTAICDGSYTLLKKLTQCKYCNIPFEESIVSSIRASHTRWCKQNPKREEYKKTNTGSQLRTKEAIEKRIVSIKKAHADGKYAESHAKRRGKPGKPHSNETKQILREKALASPHRRLRRKMIDYKGIQLDSTWELALAKRLDDLCIRWIRPEPITWEDEDLSTHHYFPDFYLPEYNLFLDPKNPQACKVQKKKIKKLLTQHKNIIIIKSLQECEKFNIGEINDQKR